MNGHGQALATRRTRTPHHRRFTRGRRIAFALTAALAGLIIVAPTAAAEIVHEERSLYQNVLVTRQGSRICLQFRRSGERRSQSCKDERRPRHMVLSYTRMMMGALLVMPNPNNILVVGLGGGSLPTALAELLPKAHIDVVEIDAAVAAVAERFFGFEPGPTMRVVVQDARVFTRRASRQAKRYDLIMLDAFRSDYIPEHLMTVEYLQETRALLSARGVVAANTFRDSGLYDHESETYHQAFGSFINFQTGFSLNRVIFASVAPLPDAAEIEAAARQWRPKLRGYGVRIAAFPGEFNREQDWDRTKRPLTDQYHPANLLRNGEEPKR